MILSVRKEDTQTQLDIGETGAGVMHSIEVTRNKEGNALGQEQGEAV